MKTSHFSWLVGAALAAVVGAGLPACTAVVDENAMADDGEEGTASSVDALAIAGRWKLSPEARSAGATMFVSYDNAPAWNSKLCGGGLKAGTRKLRDFLDKTFSSQIDHAEGYACRPNTANTSRMSMHGTGRALDIFIPMSNGGADNTKGDLVANYLVLHAEELQIQYMIWDRTQWRANGTNDRLYTGPHPHNDHLHVEITTEAANLTAPWYK